MSDYSQPPVIGAIKKLYPFISAIQLEVIADGLRTPERDHFSGKLLELANRIEMMPRTYEQEGESDPTVFLHYFYGGCDWWITERDMENEQLQAYGLADLGHGCAEMGYISLPDLFRVGVELDLFFEPRPLSEIKEKTGVA